MEEIKKKIENLKAQQEQAKEVFIKCSGAIEVLEAMLKESEGVEEAQELETV